MGELEVESRLRFKRGGRLARQLVQPAIEGARNPALAQDEPASHLHTNTYDDGEEVHNIKNSTRNK